MGKDFSKQLSKQIGENLLVAKLGELGIVASTLTGNVPDIDVLAYRQDGKRWFKETSGTPNYLHGIT